MPAPERRPLQISYYNEERQKFVVDGSLRPKGTGAAQPVRTVWMVAEAGDEPRFVTAYPSLRVIH